MIEVLTTERTSSRVLIFKVDPSSASELECSQCFTESASIDLALHLDLDTCQGFGCTGLGLRACCWT